MGTYAIVGGRRDNSVTLLDTIECSEQEAYGWLNNYGNRDVDNGEFKFLNLLYFMPFVATKVAEYDKTGIFTYQDIRHGIRVLQEQIDSGKASPQDYPELRKFLRMDNSSDEKFLENIYIADLLGDVFRRFGNQAADVRLFVGLGPIEQSKEFHYPERGVSVKEMAQCALQSLKQMTPNLLACFRRFEILVNGKNILTLDKTGKPSPGHDLSDFLPEVPNVQAYVDEYNRELKNGIKMPYSVNLRRGNLNN